MSRRYLRPGALVGHVLVLAAALTCLRLGWWQWTVFEAARGTGQNLGYSLLWPVFAGAFIYMWLRFLQLEEGREAEREQDPDDPGATAGPVGDTAPERAGDDVLGAEAGRTDRAGRTPRRRHTSAASEVTTVGVGFIGDDDDDPELAAYNRALAQLAEQDDYRAD